MTHDPPINIQVFEADQIGVCCFANVVLSVKESK